ncbi:MAG: hypothetical protein ACLUI3_07200 [Christensenellales bacterium]
MLAAYRLTDVYARFAVGEALAMVFLPLFIAALWDCVAGDKNRWKRWRSARRRSSFRT